MFSRYLLQLKLTGCFTNPQLLRVAHYIMNAQNVPQTYEALLRVAQIKFDKRGKSLAALRKPELKQILAQHETKCQYLTVLDARYPMRLLQSYDPPAVLFYAGNLDSLNQSCVGIVGARRCTSYGMHAVEQVLPRNEALTVISGLAEGVDRQAHQVALRYGLPTVAVIGNGLDVVYPKQNAQLQTEIKQQGLVLSEYPLGMKPQRYHFPQRNRIIAGLVHGLLVVEAKQKSGSLITANLALKNNRTVMAIPGSLFSPLSQGTNDLINTGATPISSRGELMENLSYYP